MMKDKFTPKGHRLDLETITSPGNKKIIGHHVVAVDHQQLEKAGTYPTSDLDPTTRAESNKAVYADHKTYRTEAEAEKRLHEIAAKHGYKQKDVGAHVAEPYRSLWSRQNYHHPDQHNPPSVKEVLGNEVKHSAKQTEIRKSLKEHQQSHWKEK